MTDNPGTALASEITALEVLLAKFAELNTRDDPARRFDLVRLRRELARQIEAIGRLGDIVFADSEHYREYRQLYSAMRGAAAAHQANWPAVRLGENAPEFAKSARPMREANRRFITWTKSQLPPILSRR